jgi:acetyltransferase-like isoleucine patch superfamily enzyme
MVSITGGRLLPHDWYPDLLPENVSIGDRSWLYSSYAFLHYASRRPNGVRIGRDTGVYDGTRFQLGPDGEVSIGDFVTLVSVIFATNGRISIGDYAFIAHDVVFADDPFPAPSGAPGTAGSAGGEFKIGRNVWIGAQATLLGDVKIGEGSVVGAAAVVTGEVRPYTIVAGNPARIVGRVPHGKR